MRTSLTDSGFLDGLPAAMAWIACLLVNLNMVLKISTAVDPVDAGAVGFDSPSEGKPDGVQQPGGVLQVERLAGLERVNPGSEKRFIRVDIAQACQEMLIEQKRLYHPFPFMQHCVEPRGG